MNSSSNTPYNVSDEYCETHYHSLSREFATTVACYYITLSMAALLFNSVLIQTILQNKILHSKTNVFIVNLAICDLITALTTLPFDADFLLRRYYGLGEFVCGLKETVFMFSLPSAIVNLLLLTFDRFILIVFPHRHRSIFTKTTMYIIIITSWSYTLMVGFFALIYDSNAVNVSCGVCQLHFPISFAKYQVIINFGVPLISILLMNVCIFQVAKKHGRSTVHKKKNCVQVHYRAAKIIMIVCGVCLLCWLTYIVIVFANILCYGCYPRWMTWTGNAINHTSIVLNPILYGLLNRKIRTAVRTKYSMKSKKMKRKEDQLMITNSSMASNQSNEMSGVKGLH